MSLRKLKRSVAKQKGTLPLKKKFKSKYGYDFDKAFKKSETKGEK